MKVKLYTEFDEFIYNFIGYKTRGFLLSENSYLDANCETQLNELKGRSCEGCEYYHSKKIYHPNYRDCNNIDGFCYLEEVKYDFYCNKYKAKK
jgi:hypothetical protein